MIDLQHRSQLKELLDADNIPFADIRKNMQELDIINRCLGGHAITLKGLTSILTSSTKNITICEIGCGGGDNLVAIDEWCSNKNIKPMLIGIDIKKECVQYATDRNKNLNASWVCSDYQLVEFNKDVPDIIFSSLFCHHFNQEQLVNMLQWMNINCSKGFFINDLQRHPLAYYSIKWLTRLFSRSYLVKNDAPLSVARGFTTNEWVEILEKAGIGNYSIKWKWAFRHLIVVNKYTSIQNQPNLKKVI